MTLRITIKEETRRINIAPELRTIDIKAETRTIIIPVETRQLDAVDIIRGAELDLSGLLIDSLTGDPLIDSGQGQYLEES